MGSIGERIVELRKEKGISQVDLAKKINVSPSTMCRWEKNERIPCEVDIQAMADFFSVSPDSFMENYKRRLVIRWGIFLIIVLVAMAIMMFCIIELHHKRSSAFKLLNENWVLNQFDERVCNFYYLLPKGCTEKAVRNFSKKQSDALLKDSSYDNVELFSFFFYSSDRDYQEDNIGFMFVYFRD